MANKSNGKIETRLELKGEKQYREAIANANRQLKMLRQELRVETAQLGNNASAQDKARAKTESLKKQIEEQKKVVAELEKAYAASQTEFADNVELQEKWRMKLLQSQETLAKLQNDLDSSSEALEDLGDGFEKAENGVEKAVQEVVSFKDAMDSTKAAAESIGSAITSVFDSMKESISKVVTEMYALITSAAASASNWDMIQGIYGGTVEEIQQVFKGGASYGFNFEEMARTVQMVTEKVKDGSEEMNSFLSAKGIDPSSQSAWATYMDVMKNLAEYHDDTGAWDGLVIDIFGGGYDDLKVLDKWQSILSAGQEKQEAGLFFDQETVNQLTEMNNSLSELTSTWTDLKEKLGAELAMTLNVTGLTEDVTAILQDVAAIFNGTGDTKELSLKFTDDVTKLIEDIQTALGDLSSFLGELGTELEGSDNDFLAFIGKLINSLSKLLDWVAANGDTIIAWLDTLLPYMTANKGWEFLTGSSIPETLGGLLSTGASIFSSVHTWSLLGKAAAEGFGASATGTAVGSAAASAMGSSSIGSSIGTAIGTAAKAVLGSAAASIGTAIGAAIFTMLYPGSAGADETDSFYVNEDGSIDYSRYKDGSAVSSGNRFSSTDEGWNFIKDENGNPVIDEYGNYTDSVTGEKLSAGIKSDVDMYGKWGAYNNYVQNGTYGEYSGLSAAANMWWDLFRANGWDTTTGLAAEEIDALMGGAEWRDLTETLDTDLLDLPDAIVAVMEKRLNEVDTITPEDLSGTNAVLETIATNTKQAQTINLYVDLSEAGNNWAGGSLRRTVMTK